MKSFSSILVDACRSLLVLTLFVCCCNASLQAQTDITGTWQGRFLSHSFDLGEPKLVIEIHAFGDSMFTGITHLYYNGNFYEHYKMIGKYFRQDSILAMKESSTIAVDLGKYGNCLGTYIVKLSRRADKLVLEGVWATIYHFPQGFIIDYYKVKYTLRFLQRIKILFLQNSLCTHPDEITR